MFLILTLEFIFYLIMFPVCIVLSIIEGIIRIPICIIFKLEFKNPFFLTRYTEWGNELARRSKKFGGGDK